MVLFLCTGNYYRSRLAEALFNYYAIDIDLPISSSSRGLGSLWPNPINPGELSEHTAAYLEALNLKASSRHRKPLPCAHEDLVHASHVVLMSREEHLSMFREQFPEFPLHRVQYWEVGDVGVMEPAEAMEKIHLSVSQLIYELVRASAFEPVSG